MTNTSFLIATYFILKNKEDILQEPLCEPCNPCHIIPSGSCLFPDPFPAPEFRRVFPGCRCAAFHLLARSQKTGITFSYSCSKVMPYPKSPNGSAGGRFTFYATRGWHKPFNLQHFRP